jgi:ATP-dependent DNA ligase
MWQVYVISPTHAIGDLLTMANWQDELTSGEYSTACSYYTAYGAGSLKTVSTHTTLTTGKNIGRANETSPITQAMAECGSAWSLKIKKGFTIAPANDARPASPAGESTQEQLNTHGMRGMLQMFQDKKLFPMALQPWKHHGKIQFPAIVQPKLDGVRCVARLGSDGSVRLESRGGVGLEGFHTITSTLAHLYDQLLSPTTRIDGELYIHGVDLQEISGIARRSEAHVAQTDTLGKEDLIFHMFDVFDPMADATNSPQSTTDRMTVLASINTWVQNSSGTHSLQVVDSHIVQTMEDSDELFNSLTEAGYEGIVYKNANARYEWSESREKRSMNFIKRKTMLTDEFTIVDFTSGKGKHANCVVFILQTQQGNTFNMVTLGSTAQREELLRECRVDFSKFKNKLATVKYDALSSEGVPLRGQIVEVDRVM